MRLIEDAINQSNKVISNSSKPNKIIHGKPVFTPTVVSVISLIFSIVSIGLTIIINWHDIRPGEITPLKPSKYVIIRGIPPHHPSDHLVLPLEWLNRRKNSAVIRHPTLILRELDKNSDETGDSFRFPMAGEFSEISEEAFSNSHILASSFILEPHTLSNRIVVFHIENWWDKESENFNWRFKYDQIFRVYIKYEEYVGVKAPSQHETYLFDLHIYPWADGLTIREEIKYREYWWDDQVIN